MSSPSLLSGCPARANTLQGWRFDPLGVLDAIRKISDTCFKLTGRLWNFLMDCREAIASDIVTAALSETTSGIDNIAFCMRLTFFELSNGTTVSFSEN